MSIASEITRLQTDSAAIASAISAKGVTVPSGSGYDDYATLIGQISGGGGTGPFSGSFVTYLEGTGTQYVDIGYIPNPSTVITLDAQLTETGGITLVGMYKGSNSPQRFHIGSYQSQWHFGVGNYNAMNSWKNVTAVAFDTQRHTFVISGDGSCSVDSSTIKINPNNNSTYIGTLAVFAQHNVGAAPWTYDSFAKMKLYGLIIKENDTIVHNYKPCRIGQVGLLYDTVSGNFYSNLGTGAFSYGSDTSIL